VKWPDAVPLEPGQATASRAIEALARTSGQSLRPLVLAAGPLAAASGWAGESAVALARAFAARGERVTIADLSLDRPELHELLGVDNEEGLSDVFLFGISLAHITRTVPEQSFHLIPASPFTPDAREVLEHEGWRSLLGEMASSQTRLLLYLPMNVEGAEAFVAGRDFDVVVLMQKAEPGLVRLAETGRVAAVFVPHQHAPELERRSDADFEKIRIPKDSARDALIADLRARQRAALMAPTPTMAPLPESEGAVRVVKRGGERAAGTPGPIFRLPATHPTGKSSSDWVSRWLFLGVLLGIAGFAGWYWYDTYGRETASRLPASVLPAAVTRRAASPVMAETKGEALPFSVAIASYQAIEQAEARVTQLREEEPDIDFFVGPWVAQGALSYRVMAGPVGDSASATALVDALVQKRIKTITSGWDVLTTPYAFFLGEYASLEDAKAQQRTAALKAIPSYIVEVASPDGSTHHKVYAGAYAGHGDAEFMRPILKAAGLPQNLVERTGSIHT
jgi:cell division septation protein DedD